MFFQDHLCRRETRKNQALIIEEHQIQNHVLTGYCLFVHRYCEIPPEVSQCSPTRSGGLYVDRGRYFTVPLNKQAVSRLLPGKLLKYR